MKLDITRCYRDCSDEEVLCCTQGTPDSTQQQSADSKGDPVGKNKGLRTKSATYSTGYVFGHIHVFVSVHAHVQVYFFISMIIVSEFMGRVRNVVLINVYLDLENPGGSGFWVGGYMSQVREWGS